MSKANVVFNLEFVATEYASNNVLKKVDKQVSSKDMNEYYNRDEACDKTITEIDTEDAFNYYNYRVGSTGCFNRNKMIESEEYMNLIEKYKPQVVYRGVLSFDDEFAIRNNIKSTQKMRELIKKTMDKNIKAMGFESNNVEWFAYYHTNTKHPHVHFHFYEKEPKKKMFLISENRLKQVKSNVTRLMKLNTDLYMNRDENKRKIFDKLEEIGLSKNARDLLIASDNNSKRYFKVDLALSEKFKELEKIIPNTGSMKYNSSNISPYKPRIKEMIDDILNKKDIKNLYEEFQEDLDKEIESQIILYGGKKDDKYKQKFKMDHLNDIETRLGNMILENIKAYRYDCKTFEKSMQLIDNPDAHRKYAFQRTQSHELHNIRTRCRNFYAGISRELCSDIEKSYYSTMKMKRMAEEAHEKAQQESYRLDAYTGRVR